MQDTVSTEFKGAFLLCGRNIFPSGTKVTFLLMFSGNKIHLPLSRFCAKFSNPAH